MYKNILNSIEHRHEPLPTGPWLLTQRWDHLLFMHLPVSKEIIKQQIPKELELDTYEGQAWITIIPFKVNGMRPRKLPPIPFHKSYIELNVRTYVKHNGIKGIYFFSLDADKLLAVLGARFVTLPYFHAKMKWKRKGDTIYFESYRKENAAICFKVSYKPTTTPFYPEEGSLSHWLLERYSLWTYKHNSLYRGDIHHRQWKIQNAEAIVEKGNMLPFLEDKNLGTPIFHYAYSRRTLFWAIKKVE